MKFQKMMSLNTNLFLQKNCDYLYNHQEVLKCIGQYLAFLREVLATMSDRDEIIDLGYQMVN
jgi:hypothetical protein